MGKFINPFTDFGFKHIFGREMDKDILIEFLNDLLEGEHTIMDLRIMNNERLPETEQGRKVIFDIHCETDKGERIIIEMQNREQPHFKDRALYYLSHSVVEQGIKGTWDYELAAVYGVFFLNFTLDEENSIPLEELHDGLDIGVLYGIGNATRASTIEHWMGKYWDEIWEHSVLIGDTQGGSFYVLMCEGEDTGVWFWDDCWEYEATNEKKNTYFVAKSFTEFINLLGGKLELPDGRVWKPAEA